MKKVIIFDLDGTLLDTLIDLRNAVNFAMSKMGYPLRTTEQVRKDIGNGVAKLIERSVPKNTSKDDYFKALEIFKQSYRSNYDVNTHAYKGCVDLISRLQNEGYIVTVATNKIIDVAKILLDHHYPNQFDYIQGDAEGVKKKPDRNMIDNIVNHYKVDRSEVLYIGDTNVDEQTAVNSEVDYALVTYGYRTIEEIKNSCNSTNLLNTTDDIYKYIKSFN